MKKFVYALFVATFLVLLFGCKNFMEGGDLSKSLSEAIDYANATLCPVTITPANEGEGSTDPSGKTNAKIGYETAIKFRQSDDYQFVRWETNSDKITFLDETDPETYFTLAEGAENLKVTAYSVRRMEMIGQPAPIYTQNGVSRDRDITVTFSMNPSMENFIFKLEEIDQIKKDNPGCEVVEIKNADGQIYAYKVYKNGYWQSYFKNISITSSNGNDSEVEHFQQPKIEDKRLIIETDRTNPIAIKGEQKDLKVVINANIFNEPVTDETSSEYYPYSFPMNKTISWEYRVTKQTDEKAFITIKAQKSEMGDVYPPNVMNESFNMDQTIELDFTEDSAYQFVRWDYDSSILSISNPLSRQTTAKVINKNAQENGTEVIAVCKPKLKIISFKPVIDDDVTSVPKNSQILIKFDHPLPDENDEKFKQQLDDILISSNGIDITDSFGTPKIIDNDTVVFDADKQNMIEVKDNEIKNITVTIPSTFYYIAEDTDGSPIKVSIGGNGKSFNYKINNTTVHKTNVKYNLDVSIASGSLINNVTKQQTYATGTQDTFIFNDGETVELNFIPSKSGSEITEYKIKGWKVECDDTTKNDFTVTSQNIENKGSIEVKKDDETYFELLIDENNPSKAYAISYKAMGTDSNDGTHLKISVYQYLVPKISDYSPKYIKEGVECDTPIVIDFTKEINKNSIIIYNEATHQGTLKLVSNSNPDIHYEDYIENITWSNSNRKLTIMLNANINKEFENDETLYLDVILDGSKIIDSDGKYLEGTEKWSYRINKNTTIKTKIKFFESLDETGYSVTVNGVYDVGAEVGYSLNQTISIECVPRAPSEYRLTDWNIPDAYKDYISVENTNSSKTTLTIKKISPDTLNINPIVLQMPVVLDEFTKPSFVSQGVNMDTPLQFTFNKAISSDTIALYDPAGNSGKGSGNIQIINLKDNSHIEEYFKAPYLDNTGKILTIKSNGENINEIIPTNGKINFKVIFMSNIKENDSTYTLKELYGDEGFEVTFCYNSARNTADAPSMEGYNFKLTGYNEAVLSKGSTSDIISMNHINKTVRVAECNAFDVGSGIKGLFVEETLVEKVDGTECYIPVVPDSKIYGMDAVKESETEYGEYSIEGFDYELKSEEDGVVKLVFRAINNAGTVSDQYHEYYVVKDTQVNVADYYIETDKTLESYIEELESQIASNKFVNIEIIDDTYFASFYVEKDKWGKGKEDAVKVCAVQNSDSDETPPWNNCLEEEKEDTKGFVIGKKVSDTKYTFLNHFGTDDVGVLSLDVDLFNNPTRKLLIGLEDSVGNRKVLSYFMPRKGAVINVNVKDGENWLETDKIGYSDVSCEYTNHIFFKQEDGTIIKKEYDDSSTSINVNGLVDGDNCEIYSLKSYTYITPSGHKKTLFGKAKKYEESNDTLDKRTEGSYYKPVFEIEEVIPGPSGSSYMEIDYKVTNYDSGRCDEYLFLNTFDESFNNGVDETIIKNQNYWNRSVLLDKTGKGSVLCNTNSDTGKITLIFVSMDMLQSNKGYYYLSDPVTIDIPVDNVPPALVGPFEFTDANATEICADSVIDNGIPAYKGLNDTFDISYWIVPYRDEWYGKNYDHLLAPEELQNLGPAMHTTAHNGEKVSFPLEGAPAGTYLLVAKFADKNGNYFFDGVTSFVRGNYSFSERNNSLSLSIYKGKLTADFAYKSDYDEQKNCECNRDLYPNAQSDIHNLTTGYCKTDLLVEYFNTSTDLMEKREDVSIRDGTNSTIAEYTFNSQNTFYRVQVRGIASKENNYRTVFSLPKYIYYDGSNNIQTTCTEKGVSLKNSFIAYVKCTGICLAETVHSKFEITSEDDWETYGIRTGAQLIDTDTAYGVDYDSIESGDYYCVIVHYADGTKLISEVRQK